MTVELDAAGVVRYLQDHPEFFADHAELLTALPLASQHGDKAISLAERQLQILRDKLRQLEGKLAELVRFGEENDAISAKVHQLGLALMAAASIGDTVRALYAHLCGAFAVPHVAMRLWDVGASSDAEEFTPVAEATRQRAAGLVHPYCGPSIGGEAVDWFGEGGEHVRSLAVIPLRRDGRCNGALVLGSEELRRFFPEMATLYLARIGDMSAAAVARSLG